MLPIEMATENRHSKEIVYDLLRHDMPIDMKEKSVAKLIPHQHSWTHLVSQSNDYYHDVVSKVLQQCSQPQILALSQIQNESGEVALVTATPLCKHEFRVSFRLFHTLEVVDTTVSLYFEANIHPYALLLTKHFEPFSQHTLMKKTLFRYFMLFGIHLRQRRWATSLHSSKMTRPVTITWSRGMIYRPRWMTMQAN